MVKNKKYNDDEIPRSDTWIYSIGVPIKIFKAGTPQHIINKYKRKQNIIYLIVFGGGHLLMFVILILIVFKDIQ